MVARVEEMLLTYGATHSAPMLWVSHDPAQLGRVSRHRFLMESNGQLIDVGATQDER
jgi:ABC-type phosphate transport system ATPase subunit